MLTDREQIATLLKEANIKYVKILFKTKCIHVKNSDDVGRIQKLLETTQFKDYSIVYGFSN
jgi:hypothetical protein